jgi:hypothetical protein
MEAKPLVADYVLDVTVSVRFHLEKNGLRLNKGHKSGLLGFFNPIPPLLKKPASLCIVFTSRGEEPEIVI